MQRENIFPSPTPSRWEGAPRNRASGPLPTGGRRGREKLSARTGCCAVLAFALALTVSPANAGELQADVGLALRHSTWRGDVTGGGQVGAGYRFARVLAVDFAVWEELATVDSRLDTGLTFGVTGALPLPDWRPTLRLYFVHQHEEGLVSVSDHPFGTIAGIGTGIRHRAGAGAKLGVEIPLESREARAKKKVEWVALAGLDGTWFPDATLGPSAYFGVTFGVGLNYRLAELP